MNARETIAHIRAPWTLDKRGLTTEESNLLADLALEGLASFRSLIETECPWVGPPIAESARDGWWDTSRIYDGIGDTFELGENALISLAVSALERAGELERKPDESHMVRFMDCTL